MYIVCASQQTLLVRGIDNHILTTVCKFIARSNLLVVSSGMDIARGLGDDYLTGGHSSGVGFCGGASSGDGVGANGISIEFTRTFTHHGVRIIVYAVSDSSARSVRSRYRNDFVHVYDICCFLKGETCFLLDDYCGGVVGVGIGSCFLE